jgi:hypothetical protein
MWGRYTMTADERPAEERFRETLMSGAFPDRVVLRLQRC